MYYLVECLIIRDENQYLIEHLSKNVQSGIEHFYIYDNKSEVPVRDFLKQYDRDNNTNYSSMCTIELFEDSKYTQVDCYRKFLNDHRQDTKWCAFIDTDEVFEGSLIDLCRHNEDYLCLRIHQILHGANGRAYADFSKTMTELYKPHIIKEPRMVKCVSQVQYVLQQNPHHSLISAPIPQNKWLRNVYPYEIEFHHYFTRSFEEWLLKFRRGSVMSNWSWKFKLFFRENTISEEDKEALMKKYGFDMNTRMKGNSLVGRTWGKPYPTLN